jgi:hypothetical protein
MIYVDTKEDGEDVRKDFNISTSWFWIVIWNIESFMNYNKIFSYTPLRICSIRQINI